MKKTLLCVLFMLCLVLVLPRDTIAAETGGSCGENVQWVLKDGIVTITGTGPITSSPWLEHRDEIYEVIIREGVTVIPDGAFADCANLCYVTVEPGLAYVGTGAFTGYEYLLMYWHGSAPEFARNWKSENYAFIHYPMGDETWPEARKHNYVTNTEYRPVSYALSGFCGDNLAYHIDGTVMTICGTGAMDSYYAQEMPPWLAYDHFITKLIIEDGVTSIGSNAFSGFDSITELVIPEGVTVIESMGFKDCYNLQTVSLPDSLTHIWDFAFDHCVSLQELKIPKSVEVLFSEALDYCTGLKRIYFYGDPPVWGGIGIDVNATAYYPAGNANWTEEVRKSFGEGITWMPLEEPHQHTFGDWVQVKAPTTEETGIAERKCTSCGEVERMDIPKLDLPAPTEPPVTVPPTTVPPTTVPPETTVPSEPTVPATTVPVTDPTQQPTQAPTTQPGETQAPTTPPGTEQPQPGGEEDLRAILPSILIAGVLILFGGAASVWFFLLRKRK